MQLKLGGFNEWMNEWKFIEWKFISLKHEYFYEWENELNVS